MSEGPTPPGEGRVDIFGGMVDRAERERARRSDQYAARVAEPGYTDRLRECYEALGSEPIQVIAPGDLVRWKPGLRNKRYPHYGAPAIVLEVLNEPMRNEREDPDSPYFREPLDLVLGLIDAEGEFVTFFFDRRRFEHVPEQGSAERNPS